MTPSGRYPKLRWPIDLRIENVSSQEVLIISCPLGISPQPVALVAAVAPIVACFEGNLSVEEIVDRFKPYGIQRALVDQLIGILEDNFFLSSPRFFEAQKTMKEAFSAQSVRPAALAGLSYQNDPAKLSQEIDKYLQSGQEILASGVTPISGGTLVGLVSPHIDYRRGHLGYGITYSALRGQTHDLYVLIGTSHQYSPHMFHLTAKDFQSPLGTLPCDTTFVSKLAGLYGIDRSFADEFLHRREHSLELQVPFLQRTLGNPKIVPILVGSFHRLLQKGTDPRHIDEYESFVASLTECLRERIQWEEKICFIAGVDMAHVGRSFGDEGNLTPEFMQEVAERDRLYLDAIERQNKQGLLSHIAEDGDRRRICGFPTMYSILDVLERLRINYQARLFDYRQAVDYSSDCGVTFAGMGLYQL